MKLLRLGNSQDFQGVAGPDESIAAVAERAFQRSTGEQMETVTRAIWPNDSLPEVVDRWMEREEPDAVFLTCATFWVAFPSVPLRIRRRLKLVGPALASAGLTVAGTRRLGHTRAVRRARWAALRTIGADYHFEPEYAAGVVERVARAVLQREPTLLVMRGPIRHWMPSFPERTNRGTNMRTEEFDQRLRELAGRLHIPYLGYMDYDQREHPEQYQGDELHLTAAGMAFRGEREGAFLAEEWMRVRVTLRD